MTLHCLAWVLWKNFKIFDLNTNYMTSMHHEEEWISAIASIQDIFNLPGYADDFQGSVDALTNHINFLINNDFNKLVAILYRLDINETKLRKFLSDYPQTDAGKIISKLIIERQIEKLKSRKQNKPDIDIPGDEKW